MIFTMVGGGGAGLNFEVAGNPKPSSPKENTIWVDTDVDITSWVFSPTEPTAEDGKVWIKFGISGDVSFNALKKNGIVLYPTEAYQCINGSWSKKPIEVYQSGAWADFIVYLFNNGDVTKVSGGWTVVAGKLGAYSQGKPSLKVNSDSLVVKTNDGMGFIKPNNLIDLTPYTTVHYAVTAVDHSGYTSEEGCCPIIMPPGETDANEALAMKELPSFGTFEDLQVDVTNINQNAYVGWWMYNYGNASMNATATIREIWFT